MKNQHRSTALVLKVVRELIRKINDPLLLLALGESVIIGLISIKTQVFPESAGVVLIGIFLIATIYFLVIRLFTITKSKKKQVRKNKKR